MSSWCFAESSQTINSTNLQNDSTKKQRWFDRRHQDVQDWLDKSSNHIDNWFGDIDRSRPATANLRLIIDQQWNEYDGYEIHPRVRGKIRLPTLEKRLSIMFGDDDLDRELQGQVQPNQQHYDTTKTIDSKQTRKDNSSLALRLSKWNDHLPFDADFDIGIRSYDNVFARLRASKDWKLGEKTGLYTEQMYRYSTKKKHEVRSFWDIHYQENDTTRTAWQSNLYYEHESEDDLSWDSSVFRQQHFAHPQFSTPKRLSYGVQALGYFNSENLYAKEWEMNRWGAFASWRQPLWREWFFVQADVNYLNDKRLNRKHYPSANLRFEFLF